jgi:hypothetical protein
MPNQKGRIPRNFKAFQGTRAILTQHQRQNPLPFSIWNPHLVIPKVKGVLLRKVPNKTQVTKLEEGKKLARIRVSLSSPFTLSQNSFNVRAILTPLAEPFAPYRSRARTTLDLVSRNNRIASESSGDLSQSMWAEALNDQGTLSFLPSMNPDATEDLRGSVAPQKPQLTFSPLLQDFWGLSCSFHSNRLLPPTTNNVVILFLTFVQVILILFTGVLSRPSFPVLPRIYLILATHLYLVMGGLALLVAGQNPESRFRARR